MRTFRHCLLALFVALLGAGCASTPQSQKLRGAWDVQTMNMDQKVVTTLAISFTDEDAGSCLSGGKWKAVKVNSHNTEDKAFFPVNDPLAYIFDGDKLTIGRVDVCDGYLMLEGKLAGNQVQGDYYTFGLGGGSTLGHFRARRRQ